MEGVSTFRSMISYFGLRGSPEETPPLEPSQEPSWHRDTPASRKTLRSPRAGAPPPESVPRSVKDSVVGVASGPLRWDTRAPQKLFNRNLRERRGTDSEDRNIGQLRGTVMGEIRTLRRGASAKEPENQPFQTRRGGVPRGRRQRSLHTGRNYPNYERSASRRGKTDLGAGGKNRKTEPLAKIRQPSEQVPAR